MREPFRRLLLVTNGCDETLPAMEYGVWLARQFESHVTLLGVAEPSDRHHPVAHLLKETRAKLGAAGVHFDTVLRHGHAEDVIKMVAAGEEHDLLVLGPLGRPPLRRWLMGRSFRHIMADVTMPIFYVPRLLLPPRRVLVCLGGLGYATTAERLGLQIAGVARASLTLLHVVPPVSLEYPLAQEILEHWEDLPESDTLPGRTIRRAKALAIEAGLEAEVRVRHGSVITEILDEFREGNYDLLCMGSPYSAHSLLHLYTPNVTAEVAEAAFVPLLTARYDEPMPESRG
ncbi:MAG: universal stress protein [Anaerolineae bacterium]|nr:MAG: universal stress protein [Anaerolineae bacterium]